MPPITKQFTLPMAGNVQADAKALIAKIEKEARLTRLQRVQILMHHADYAATEQRQALSQQICAFLAHNNVHSQVSVRHQPEATPRSGQAAHDLTLFERPTLWQTLCAAFRFGKSTSSKPAQPAASTTTAAQGPFVCNQHLHKAFRLAVEQDKQTAWGSWAVQKIEVHYADEDVHRQLSPLVAEMPAAELLAYLCARTAKDNLLPADTLVVEQQIHACPAQDNPFETKLEGESPVSDLWIKLALVPFESPTGHFEQLSGETIGVSPTAAHKAKPPVAHRLKPGCSVQDVVRETDKCIKPGLKRVEVRLSRMGHSIDPVQLRSALAALFQQRGQKVPVSIRPFPYALQHADAEHTLTCLFDASAQAQSKGTGFRNPFGTAKKSASLQRQEPGWQDTQL